VEPAITDVANQGLLTDHMHIVREHTRTAEVCWTS